MLLPQHPVTENLKIEGTDLGKRVPVRLQQGAMVKSQRRVDQDSFAFTPYALERNNPIYSNR